MDCLQDLLDRLFEECENVASLRCKIKFIRKEMYYIPFNSDLYNLFMSELKESVNLLHSNDVLFEMMKRGDFIRYQDFAKFEDLT